MEEEEEEMVEEDQKERIDGTEKKERECTEKEEMGRIGIEKKNKEETEGGGGDYRGTRQEGGRGGRNGLVRKI